MQITITIQDADEQRLIGKIAKYNGWENQIVDINLGLIDNPVTKRQFVKAMLVNYLKRELQRVEMQELLESVVASEDVAID